MKSINMLFLLFVTSSFMIGGCNKESPLSVNDGEKIINNSFGLKDGRAPDMRMPYFVPVYVDGVLVGYTILGCWWPPSNCLPTVVISGSSGTSLISNEIETAYNDFIEKFNNGNVSEFFISGDYLTLFPELENMPDVVKGLGNSEIILHFDIGVDGFDYYVGLPSGTDYLSDWEGDQECVFVIDNQTH